MKNNYCCLVLGKKFLREPSQWTEEPSLKTARSFGLMIDLDGDGGISKEEFLAVGVKLFNYGDEDEDDELWILPLIEIYVEKQING